MALQWRHFLIGLTVSVAYWPGILSAVFVPRWAAIAVLVPLLCSLQPRNLPGAAWGVLFVLFGCAAVSLLVSPAPLTGVHDMMLAAILVLPFLAAASMDSLDDVFTGMALGVGVSSLFVLVQDAGFRPVSQSSHLPAGLFFNSEIVAEFSALVMVWCLVRRKWALAAMCVAPLLLCHSRIAVLTVVAGLLYAAWTRWPRGTVGVACVAGCLALVAVLGLGDLKVATALHRITLWITTGMLLTPLGNGLGWAQMAFPLERFVHSDALQMLAEIGIPALAVLYIPWIIFRRKDQDIAAMAVFCGASLQFLVSFPLHFPASGFVVALVAGHLLRRRDVVCLGDDQRRIDDGAGIHRGIQADGRNHDRRGGCRATVPV